MTPMEAAKALRAELNVPLWALSIVVSSTELIVWIDQNYRFPLNIPSEYEGYPVRSETRPIITAGSQGPKP